MAQIFHPSTNTIAKVAIYSAVLVIAALSWTCVSLDRSAYVTGQGIPRPQPVQFSHDHHAGGLGIDCRYCHSTVETSAFAGMPPTATCMGCHQIVWADSPELAPVRESLRAQKPLRWTRVHDLPDFVYFNHGIHVARGVGCASCHGDVERMELMMQASSLKMQWCLDCHRHPETATQQRTRDAFTLTNCSICHR